MNAPGKPSRKTVLILGATSAIARAVAPELARRGFDLLLAGRSVFEVERLTGDLRIRYGGSAVARPFDASAFETLERFFQDCQSAAAGTLQGAVLCFGTLGN